MRSSRHRDIPYPFLETPIHGRLPLTACKSSPDESCGEGRESGTREASNGPSRILTGTYFLQSSDLATRLELPGGHALFSLVDSLFTLQRCQSVSNDPSRLLHDLVTLQASFRQPNWYSSSGIGGIFQWNRQPPASPHGQAHATLLPICRCG